MTKPYLAALVTYINRDDGIERKAMHYPITEVALFSAIGPNNPGGEPIRRFVVDGDHWVEKQQ